MTCSVSWCSLSRDTQGPSPALAPNANITYRVCVCPSLSSMYSLANGADGTTVGLIRSLGMYCNTSPRPLISLPLHLQPFLQRPSELSLLFKVFFKASY